MKRIDRFNELQNHPMLKKEFKRLTKTEFNFCVEYLRATENLDDNSYAEKTNRIGIETKLEFKNKVTIWSILSQCIEIKRRHS